jgi:hypothetical protein
MKDEFLLDLKGKSPMLETVRDNEGVNSVDKDSQDCPCKGINTAEPSMKTSIVDSPVFS